MLYNIISYPNITGLAHEKNFSGNMLHDGLATLENNVAYSQTL